MNAGFVFIDKPEGMTSHDVVSAVRRTLRTRRVGHAGTLDPAATGVLILGVGRATRLMSLASDADKEYVATIRLGQSTVTDDAEGDLLTSADASAVTVADIDAAMLTLTGDILQVPSSVSAVKVNGARSHARVRAGEDVALAARPVKVYSFDRVGLLRGDRVIDINVKVRCGSGTYVRALARDLGAALGVGGHVTTLRRTESSGVAVQECVSLERFATQPHVMPVIDVVRRWVPVITVDDPADAALRHGRAVSSPDDEHTGVVAVTGTAGVMTCLARCQDGVLQPTVVMVDPAPANMAPDA